MSLAVFMDDQAREKREALFHLSFMVLTAILAVGFLCWLCLRVGDANGYQRATGEYARKLAIRPAPIPTVDVVSTFVGCGKRAQEASRREWMRCEMAKIRKAG